jgi:threonine/homoserine/homoserine lactone efflux protein
MTWDLFVALFTFAGISAWTPGPNNTILLASGINYGFKRTVPMVLGVAFGFPFMIGIVGLGLGKVFESYPIIYSTLKYVGSAYMLWLAWKIAKSTPSEANAAEKPPMSFMQGALFQWINPKAWVMAVTATSAYTLASDYHRGLAVVVTTFVLMGLTSASGWALFGAGLRDLMNDPRYFRQINIALAIALVVSIALMLRH